MTVNDETWKSLLPDPPIPPALIRQVNDFINDHPKRFSWSYAWIIGYAFPDHWGGTRGVRYIDKPYRLSIYRHVLKISISISISIKTFIEISISISIRTFLKISISISIRSF